MPTDPVCGMFVEPGPGALSLTRDNRTYYFCSQTCQLTFAEPENERRRLARRLVVAWPLSVTIVLLTYLISFPLAGPLAAALAAVVQFYPGLNFYRGTYDALRHRRANMDILIAVGTTVAFLYSLAVLLLPGRLPSATYFDASALIITLILTGNYLEHLTRVRAGSALRRLDELLPDHADVIRNGVLVAVAPGEVRVGDRMRVAPGGRFPADGVIRSGRTSVNESVLTGEPHPLARGPGDRVLAGAINGEGAVEVEATGVGSDTFVAQVGQLLTDAEMSRVPLQKTADRIASVFVPVVLGLAILAAAGWFLLGGAGFTVALLVFVTVAITACPCAFGIATPAAILVGTGRAAESGVLFRGEDAIQRAAGVDVVVTDKTGTLTQGSPVLAAVRAADPASTDRVLSLAAALEADASHPYGRAVVAAAQTRGVPIPRASGVTIDPGRGVHGSVEGDAVEVARAGPEATETGGVNFLAEPLRQLVAEGNSVSIVNVNGVALGLLAFQDPPVEGLPAALAGLFDDRIGVVMATGDNTVSAQKLGDALGIRDVRSGLNPADKISLVRQLQREGHRVAFVGDGVNDAPALAAADLGVAIGTGTEVARESGQVILVRPDFSGVALALRLGRRTVGKVRANLAWAIGYNAVLLPVAMGALVPLYGLDVYRVLPVVGALLMGLSSTTVVLNSLSLRWTKGGAAVPTAPLRATPSH